MICVLTGYIRTSKKMIEWMVHPAAEEFKKKIYKQKD